MSVPGVSVYVLRERMQESWDKRESLREKEEEILREALGDTSIKQMPNSSFYDLALEAVVEGTKGYDNLQSWRSRFLGKSGDV
jgi:hypothetical protein